MIQTELAMVNACLEIIEESTLQAIDNTHPDVVFALDMWDKQSVTVQAKGWWYNRESFDLEPDVVTNKITLPDGVLEVDLGSTTIVKRGRFLYDLVEHTYEFSAGETVGCIMEWELEELPPIIYNLVLTRTKIDMVMGRDQDGTKLQVLGDEQAIQNAYALKADLRFSGPNRLSVNNASLLLGAQVQR